MDKKDLKKMDLTPIEDLITEDLGPIGTPERDQFEMECDAFVIGEQLKGERLKAGLTQEQLAEVLAGPTDVPLRRLAFHGVNFREMPEQALGHQYRECIFLACQLPHGFKSRLTDSLVFPDMGELFRFQTELYTADTLYEGYEVGQPETIEKCFDGRVYKHYLERGKQSTDIKETLARTLHDHSISNALHHFLDDYREHDIIGVMGGHGMLRTDVHYRQIAQISKTLTEKGKLMISGGGPGAMEATHLGAWMAGRTDEEAQEAIHTLSAAAPSFKDRRWLSSPRAFDPTCHTHSQILRQLHSRGRHSDHCQGWNHLHTRLGRHFTGNLSGCCAEPLHVVWLRKSDGVHGQGLLAIGSSRLSAYPRPCRQGTLQESHPCHKRRLRRDCGGNHALHSSVW